MSRTVTAGTIGEYTTAGATVNAALISGLNGPLGIAVSGSNLFVANYGDWHDRRIHHLGGDGERRADLGVERPVWALRCRARICLSRTFAHGTIGEYTTSGATVNAALISGLNDPHGIAVSGSDLFVTNA